MMAGKLIEALEVFEIVLKKQPKNVLALQSKGVVYQVSNKVFACQSNPVTGKSNIYL